MITRFNAREGKLLRASISILLGPMAPFTCLNWSGGLVQSASWMLTYPDSSYFILLLLSCFVREPCPQDLSCGYDSASLFLSCLLWFCFVQLYFCCTDPLLACPTLFVLSCSFFRSRCSDRVQVLVLYLSYSA